MSRFLQLRKKSGWKFLDQLLISPSYSYRCNRSIETIAFEEVRSSPTEPCNFTAFVLHGLLGSGRNWRSFSKTLASSLPEWRMVLVDLRNHGRSAEKGGLLPPHYMENAANDLANLVNSQGWDWPNVVIGHSMGGKVALQFAQSCARGHYGQSAALPKQLWILDSVAGKVTSENSDGEVEKVLQTLQTLPRSVPSRKWLVDHMMELGFSKALSEWLGSNLKKSGDQETWAFNLEGAVEMFDSYRRTDYWPLLEDPPKGLEISIVRAEKSDRWTPDDIKRLQHLDSRQVDEAAGKVSYHVLPKSGHWVHVDNPRGLIEIVTPKIASLV